MYIDLISTITPTKYNGLRYYLLLTDNAICITENKLFKTKFQVKQAIFRYSSKIEWELKLKLKAF